LVAASSGHGVGPAPPGHVQLGLGRGQPGPGRGHRLVGRGQGGRDRTGVGAGVAQHRLDRTELAPGPVQLGLLIGGHRVGEQQQRHHGGHQRNHPRTPGHQSGCFLGSTGSGELL
jgi:hypothetical protein